MRVLLFISALFLIQLAGAAVGAELLFADPVRARGEGIEIRQSEIEAGFMDYQGARAAMGKPVPGALEEQVKEQVLEKLIATKLFLARATAADREAGSKMAEQLIEQGKSQAISEASYRRQLIAVGTTPEKYEADILEQAVVKAVIDRELKSKHAVTTADARQYYEAHPELFEEPEKVRVAHILFAVREYPSGELLPRAKQEAKAARAEEVVARARAGEDFSKLVAEFSEDPDLENTRGELTFGRKGPVPFEFEAAAFSLKPGQISDVTKSILGFHIIKVLERIPGSRPPFEKVEAAIRDRIQEEHVQKNLGGYIERLKQEAGVEIIPYE